MKKFNHLYDMVAFLFDREIPEKEKRELREYLEQHPSLYRKYILQSEVNKSLGTLHAPTPQHMERRVWNRIKDFQPHKFSYFHRIIRKPLFAGACACMSFLIVWGAISMLRSPSLLVQEHVDMYSDEILEEFPGEDASLQSALFIELPQEVNFQFSGAPRIMYTSQ